MRPSLASASSFSALAALTLTLCGCVPVVPAMVVGGATTGAIVANDRRPAEIVLGDERVEFTILNRLDKALGYKAHINITSFNYAVLLTGEVRDDKAKDEAEKIAAEVERVKGVVNELQVAADSSLGARSNDSYLTSRIKTAFVSGQKFSATHVKVVTEQGVVYLLGLVSRKEADDATEITRGIGGVQKVVRVFEYLPDDAAK